MSIMDLTCAGETRKRYREREERILGGLFGYFPRFHAYFQLFSRNRRAEAGCRMPVFTRLDSRTVLPVQNRRELLPVFRLHGRERQAAAAAVAADKLHGGFDGDGVDFAE